MKIFNPKFTKIVRHYFNLSRDNQIEDSANLDKTSQMGMSTMAMVIILLILGMALLSGFNALISSWQKSIVTEIHYYSDYNQAISSLQWGSQQLWQSPTENWQCQHEGTLALSACIKKSSLLTDNYTLLRGSGNRFHLYRLTHYQDGKLEIEKGHWLDYCPERRNYNCD